MPHRALTYEPSSRISPDSTTDDLIDVMREEQELDALKRIAARMNPALRKKCEEIHALMKTEVEAVLNNRYALGEKFLDIYHDQTQQGSRVYGKQAIPNICRLLYLDDSFVRNCIKFVQSFTREDLARLPTMPSGDPVSWSHFRCVLPLEDRSQREAMLLRTATEGMTCAELAYEIKHLGDQAQPAKQGRPLKVPATFDAAVKQQKGFTEDWERRYAKVYSHPKHSLVARAAELAPEEVTEERLREAGELAHQLRLMADQAVQAAEKAEGVVQEFARILDEHKAKSLPAGGAKEAQPDIPGGGTVESEPEAPPKKAKKRPGRPPKNSRAPKSPSKDSPRR
jgi:hypothetical protein